MTHFEWHAEETALMKSWPKVAVAVAQLREAVVRFSMLKASGAGDIVKEWDTRLNPVYDLLSDIRQETDRWHEDTIK